MGCFFDALNIDYKYEPEGYNINDIWYLPDFWIPKWNCWIEIKPDIPKLYNYGKKEIIEKKEYRICQDLAKETNNVVLLIGGDPWAQQDEIQCYEFKYGIAIFTSKPINTKYNKNENYLGIKIEDKNLFSHLTTKFFNNRLRQFLEGAYEIYPQYVSTPIPKSADFSKLIEIDKEYYMKKFQRENPNWIYGITDTHFHFIIEKDEILLSMEGKYDQNEKLIQAYSKARQARFEKNA